MDNNDILRKLRFTYDYSDNAMIDIFALAGMKVTRAEVSDWLKKEEDPAFQKMVDVQLATFLNGMIYMNRGKQEGKELPPEERLNNNIILRKLKIALNLKDEDIINILRLVDFELGKPELTSFFRATTQPQYRPLKDQIMRKFLHGLQLSVGRQE